MEGRGRLQGEKLNPLTKERPARQNFPRLVTLLIHYSYSLCPSPLFGANLKPALKGVMTAIFTNCMKQLTKAMMK